MTTKLGDCILNSFSEKDDVKRLYDELCQKEPTGIQLLVNNAGIARDDATKSHQRASLTWKTRKLFWTTSSCRSPGTGLIPSKPMSAAFFGCP